MKQTAKNTSRDTMLNTVGTFVYFFFQWLTTVCAVRLAGYDSAGILSLVVSFTNIFGFIARYGIRNYQLSDTESSFSSRQYAGAYAASSLAALAIFIVSLIFCNYDRYTLLCAVAYMAFKYFEVFSAFTFTLMQKLDSYFALAVSNCVKGVLPLAGFAAVLWLKKGLLTAIAVMAVLHLITFFLTDVFVIRKAWDFRVSVKGIVPLLRLCFPLMLSSLITPYMTFIVRHFIEKLYGSELLGFYSSVSMVVVVMTTLAGSVWVVILPSISKSYAAGEYVKLKKSFAVVSICVAAATALAVLAGKLIGNPVFSLVFGKEILPYMYLLTPVIITSGLLTLAAFFMTVLIPLKKRIQMLLCAVVGAAVLTAVVYPLTSSLGLQGANLAMIVGLTVQIAAMLIPTLSALKKRNRNLEEGK